MLLCPQNARSDETLSSQTSPRWRTSVMTPETYWRRFPPPKLQRRRQMFRQGEPPSSRRRGGGQKRNVQSLSNLSSPQILWLKLEKIQRKEKQKAVKMISTLIT